MVEEVLQDQVTQEEEDTAEVTAEETQETTEAAEEEKDSMKIAVVAEIVTAGVADGNTVRLKDFSNLGTTRKSNA